MTGFMIFSAIILFGGIQGLLLVLALSRLNGANRAANRILSGFVLLISLVLFSRLVYVEEVEIWKQYPHLFLLPDIPLFLYGPLFFLYVRRLMGAEELKGWRLWLHFVPAVMHFAILAFYLLETRAEYLQRLMAGNLIELPYIVWASLAHIAFYLGRAYLLYRTNVHKEARQQRFMFGRGYLNTFFILAAACWLSWLYAVLSQNFSALPEVSFFNYNIAWVALSFSSFILAYFAMSQPEVFKKDPAEGRYEGSTLTARQLDQFEKELAALMDGAKPYLEPQLSRQQLAQQLGLPPKGLSRLINERFGQNFSDFVNSYRVAEFKRLAGRQDNQHLTLLALAFEAGFNSKTTFNTAFKKQTGLTPAEYKQRLELSDI